MARIEKEAEIHEQLSAMRGEMLDTVQMNSRGIGRKAGCALFLLAALLAGFLFILSLVAKTGLVHVPVMSNIVYTPPQPEHNVVPGRPIEVVASEILTTALASGDQTVTVRLTEGSFTASMRAALASSEAPYIDAARTQVAIDLDGMNVWLPITGKDTAIIAHLIPSVRDGGLALSIEEVRIGSLKLPAMATDAIIRPALDASLAEFNRAYTRYARVDTVHTEPGTIVFVGTVVAQGP